MRIFALIFIFNLWVNSFFACTAEDAFRQLRSEHFVINYRQDVDRSYVSRIKDTAERYYRVITQQFNFYRDKFWIWENRAKVFIAGDRNDYLNSFKCSPWSSACVDYRQKLIYTYPDQEKFTPVFVHELTHIIFREYVGEGKLPLWLDEGVAVYMEDKYANTYQPGISFLREKIADNSYLKLSRLNSITVKDLDAESQDFVNLFYLESFSLINFIMNKYGKYKFSNFLRRLRKGETIETALSKSFYDFKNFGRLESLWKDYYLK